MADEESMPDTSLCLTPNESYLQDEEGNIYRFIQSSEETAQLSTQQNQMEDLGKSHVAPLDANSASDNMLTFPPTEAVRIMVQNLDAAGRSEQPRDPYNEPPSRGSPFTFRRFHSLNDVNTIIEKMQQSIGVVFVPIKKGKHFGTEDNWDTTQIDCDAKSAEDRNFRVSFSFSNLERSSSTFSQPFIPYDGVPFIAVSQLMMACEYKKMHKELMKCERVKEYWRKNESGGSEMTVDVDELPSKKQKMDSLFPDSDDLILEPQIPTNMEATPDLLRKLGKELREKLLEDPNDIIYEMAYYMRIPNSWAHSGHEIKVQNPILVSKEYREKILNYLLHLREREILSDIKFNVQGQKRQMKLHSPVLACAGVQIRNLLIDQDYTSLADMLMPLDKPSLDAFFNFIYSGYLEFHPNIDVDALKTAFTSAGIKEGAQLCIEQQTRPKTSSLDDWNLESCEATQQKIKCKGYKLSAPTETISASTNQVAVDIHNDILALFTQDQSKNLKRIEQLISNGLQRKDIMRTIIHEQLDTPPVSSSAVACQTDIPAPDSQMKATKRVAPRTSDMPPPKPANKVKVYVVKTKIK